MSDSAEPLWKQAISNSSRRECSDYLVELRRAAESASESEARTLRLLADVTSMALVEGIGVEPLKAMMSGPSGRTAVPEDLSDPELDELKTLLPAVHDAELCARICDVLWTRRRSPAHARQAVDEYLKAAALLQESASAWRVRVERALAFAAIMKDRERGTQIGAFLKASLVDETPSTRAVDALELLLGCGEDQPGTWAQRAEAFAKRATDAGNILLARDFHACAAKWHRRNKDDASVRRSRIAEAETYVAEAERASDAETALLMKAHFYQQAIEAFRRVGKCRERVDELHRQLLDIQQRAAATMKHFEGPTIDLTEMALAAIKELDGRGFQDALLRLATMVGLPSYEHRKKRASELAKEFPLSHLFGRQIVNDKGHIIAKAPSGQLHESSTNDQALLASMYAQHENERGVWVTGMIEPARKKIWLDHAVTEKDFLPLVANNPIVPAGREGLFARALYAGLSGDLVQAVHIAVPQVEHAIRALLNRRGVITTGLGDDGLQEESSLGTLLDKPELVDILGQDRIFDMKSLLTERGGANLRNRAAHGLMSHQEFYTAQSVYVWWLTLHFCFLPTIATIAAAGDQAGNDAAPGAKNARNVND